MNLNITLEQPDKKLALFGSADRYLRMVREAFGVQVVSRDDEIRISGDKEQVDKAAAVLEDGHVHLLDLVSGTWSDSLVDSVVDDMLFTANGRYFLTFRYTNIAQPSLGDMSAYLAKGISNEDRRF